MSSSWRIKTIYDNRSQRVLPTPGSGLGATVVRSLRGIEDPVYFGQGETQKMLNLFGAPTPDYPELLEAIEYNKSYPLWLVSPTNRGKVGGVLIGETGSVRLDAGVSVDGDKDLSSLDLYIGLEADDTGIYTGTASFISDVVIDSETSLPETFEFMIDGTEITATYSEDTGIYTFIGTKISSAIVDDSEGAISIEFAEGEEPESGAVVEFHYTVDVSSDYYILLTGVGPSDSAYLQVKVEEATVNSASAFEMSVQIKNIKGEYQDAVFSPITFSLTDTHENGFGVNIFAENVFQDSNYFVPHVNTSKSFSTFSDDESYVKLAGGYRGGAVEGGDLTAGYDHFQEVRKYPIDLFFDATADDAVPVVFSTLRTSYHKYSRFILPLSNVTPTSLLESSPISTRDRGISYYYGWFYIRNLYHSAGRVVSIPMGEIAKKHADIMLLGFGGIAPAWYDENGMGGQLNSGRIIEALYDPTEDQLKSMDESQINPIINDPYIGPMIMSRRTSVSELSDWSFIDYSGAMDYIIKNVTSQVLPYQVVKMNDPVHRNIVRTKVNSILQPMTIAPVNVVDSYYVKCDSENNNDDVKSREQFVVDLAVKFTPKSREIIFTFINTPQGSSVEEMFN